MNFKNLGFWDVSLIKLSVLAAAFFLISIWSGLATWVMETHWAWFLGAVVIFAIKPIIQVLKE